MILPGKHLKQDRALITIGGEILSILDEPMKVSGIWEKLRALRAGQINASALPFDWFVLALSLLFAIEAVDLSDDTVIPRGRP